MTSDDHALPLPDPDDPRPPVPPAAPASPPGSGRGRAARHLRPVPGPGGTSLGRRQGPPVPWTAEDRPRAIRLRSEADVLALIPYTFGFHPTESVVMVLLSGDGRPMFARVDLPTCEAEAQAACEELLQAATVNGALARGARADKVILVAFTGQVPEAFLTVGQAAEELTGAGFDVVAALRADRGRWWPLLPVPGDGEGDSYDLSSHPITASGVLEGRVTHRDRSELAASLLPGDPDAVDAVEAALALLPRLDPDDGESMRAEARWLDAWVRTHSQDPDRTPAPDEVARVVRDVADPDLRDVTWCRMRRGDAERHVRLWTAVVTRCPLDHLAPAAGVLAFAAWLSGHGALAWCAVDRSWASQPDHSLARLIADILTGAVPPSTWEPMPRDALRLLRR